MTSLFRKRFFRQASSVLVMTLVVSMAACSKKKKDDGGDTAGDAAAMQATDLAGGMGAKIPELGTVYFDFDSFNINSRSKAALRTHAEWLKSNSSRLVQIEGHCDERGTTEYNLALGERRAASVKDFLAAQGVSAGQLSTISFGEERPIVAGSDESAWAQNRRVEFVSQ